MTDFEKHRSELERKLALLTEGEKQAILARAVLILKARGADISESDDER